MKTKIRRSVFLIFPAIFSLIGFACHYAPLRGSRVAESNAPNASNTSSASNDARTDFEKDLETMRTANFEFIFVFRRKDGGAFDGEDKKYLRDNRPPEANRFISTDGDKAFIAGSHYKFPPENLEVLRLRFDVQDFSTAAQQENNEIIRSNGAFDI